jgi:two-component system, LuxR family, response regulator FixJ
LLPAIVITGFADVPVVVEVMRRGAVTLLEKPYRENELWNAVRDALKQDVESRQEYEERLRIKVNMGSLTDDERIVMKMIFEGLPNKAISIRLDLGLRTVEARRRCLLRKMNVDSVARLIQDVLVASGGRRLTDNDYFA